jgi:tetratricopeptide (TPR) repeat protein
MLGYTAVEVARILDLSVDQVKSYVRSGFLPARKGQKGELRFTFQDLVLLRAARGLLSARIPSRKVRRALARLKGQLPEGRPLAGVHISAEGSDVVVREGNVRWRPDSGQALFDFEVDELAQSVSPIVRKADRQAARMRADEWFARGCALESVHPEEAEKAYLRAIELQPSHCDAQVNLGRLLHERGELERAELLYRKVLLESPEDATAAFNLGVVLEDLNRIPEAIATYERAIALWPECADAHFNLARLYQQSGQKVAALGHLRRYKNITRGPR